MKGKVGCDAQEKSNRLID